MLQYCNSTGASSWGKRRRGTKIGLVCWNWMGSMHQPSALIGKWTLTNLNKSATKWPAFKAPTWDEMRVRNHWELKAESYLFYFVFFLFFLQVSPYARNIATRKTIFDASPGLYTNYGKAQAYVHFTCRYQNPIRTIA